MIPRSSLAPKFLQPLAGRNTPWVIHECVIDP